MIQKLSLVLLAVLSLTLTACYGRFQVIDRSPEAQGGPPPGDPRLPRQIPLRFVRYVNCQSCGSTCARTCDEGPSRADIDASVRAANEVFAPAGLSFYVRSVEHVESKHFALWQDDTRTLAWHEIEPELHRVFPAARPDSYASSDTKRMNYWLDMATTAWAQPDEITVHVRKGGARGATSFPEYGRSINMSLDAIGDHPRSNSGNGTLYLFAHEIGHYLGLRHTFEHGGINPRSGLPWPLAARWDLVYHPASATGPAVFFNSFAEAARYPDHELKLIHHRPAPGDDNCGPHQANGRLTCTFEDPGAAAFSVRTGDAALKGMSFRISQPRDPSRPFGLNVMSYGNMGLQRRLSASEIEMIHAYLTFDSGIGSEAHSTWRVAPRGAVLRSHRVDLGLPVRR